MRSAAGPELEALRQRAARFEALYESAHQMSARLDVDSVLAAICSRVKAITRAEVAYLLQYDPACDELYVRAHDGVRTEQFVAARVRPGHGLAGKVIAERRPCYSATYLRDESFVHTVDAVVDAEGLVSVIGVPVLTDDLVIGVLIAACRHATAFEPEDVAALEGLAEHGAIAIANARLFARTLEAAEEERRLRALAEDQQRRLERMSAQHERLSELMLADHPMADLLDHVGTVLGFAVEIAEDDGGGTAARLGAGGMHLGWLCPVGGDALDPEALRSLEAAGRVVAAHQLRDRAVAMVEYRVRSEFVDALLAADTAELPELLRRGRYLGVDLARPVSVLVLAPGEASRVGQAPADDGWSSSGEVAERVDVLLRSGSDAGLVSRGAGGVLVVAPTGEPRTLASRLHRELSADGQAPTIGFAGPVGVEELSAAAADARRAMEAAAVAGRGGQVVTGAELGVYPTLLRQVNDLQEYAARRLGPLLDYDAGHGTDLVATLRSYLRSGCRAADTARELHLHVNSLYYRLTRIREIAAVDLDDPDERFELELAVRMLAPPGS